MNKLYRSISNRVIAGVCGGLGEYFDIDPVIIRALFIIVSMMSGSGIVLYLILWLLIPEPNNLEIFTKIYFEELVKEMRQRASDFFYEVRGIRSAKLQNRRALFSMILILIGLMFLLLNFDIFDLFDFERLWPLFLIAIGFAMMFKRR